MTIAPVYTEQEANQQFLDVLDLILLAMEGTETILQKAANEHMESFAAQMRVKVGVESINISNSFVASEVATFRLQFFQTMERLVNTIEKNLFSRIKSPMVQEELELKAINYREPLRPQVDARIDAEVTRLTRRFKQSLDGKRQQAFGIHKYIWRSQDDDKVRPEHAANDDQVFEWAKRPATGHPGEDYNCRCYAEPTLDGAGDPRVEVANAAAAITAGVVILLNIGDKANKIKKVVDAARAADVLINTLPEDEEEQEETEEEESENEATEDTPEDAPEEPEKEPGDEEPEGEKPDGEQRDTEWEFGKHKSDTKWKNQMQDRGWTEEDITDTIRNGEEFPAPNDVRKNDPGATATRYEKDGKFVVRDDQTGEILQISGEKFIPKDLPR